MIRERIVGVGRRLVRRPPVPPPVRLVEVRPPNDLLAGRTALVVGGGRIGRATSELFLSAGARVHQADVRPGLAPPGATEHIVDVADTASIDELWNALGSPVDILVNAAGYQPPVAAFVDADPAQWRRTFDTNVIGQMYLTQLVGRELKKSHTPGSMVLIASAHHAITGGWPAYSASKAALVMFMREIALEWASSGIRINAIAPGWVAHPDEPHANDFPHTPLGSCAIPPHYIAQAALFLCSDRAAFTTGSVMHVDGGLSLRSYRTAALTDRADPHVRRFDSG